MELKSTEIITLLIVGLIALNTIHGTNLQEKHNSKRPFGRIETEHPLDANSEEVKGPVLKEGSFGFAHARHLSSEYYKLPGLDTAEHFSNRTDERASIFYQKTFAKKINNSDRSGLAIGIDEIKEKCKNIINCDEESKRFRTSDGSCNNLRRPFWGKSETAYHRILPRNPSLSGQCANKNIFFRRLPNPRLASRVLVERITEKNNKDNERGQSIYVVLWGQILDHDLLLTPLRQTAQGEFLDCCKPANREAEECCPIIPPKLDFFYGQRGIPECIPFIRSKSTDPVPEICRSNFKSRRLLDVFHDSATVRDIENSNTHYLDASYVYGSTKERSDSLRTHKSGMLKSTPDRNGRHWPPLVADGQSIRMEFGDTRGDVHPGFTLLNTLCIRYHNQIAAQLAELRRDWDDERLYQESRKIVIAVHQHITYTQWMDAMLGSRNNIRTNDKKLHQDFYSPSVDPSISMIFSTAAYRLHTLVPGSLHLRNAKHKFTGELRLRDVFHQPLKLLENSTFDDLVRGMARQPAWSFNNIFSKEMTEFLFAEENNGTFGMDIVALNVQRGRDHQIQGYTAYREFCGLGPVRSWSDMTNFIPHNLVHGLLTIYSRPEDIDMYIAANMERRRRGTLLGPTTHCLIEEQFKRTRNGDRHFYTRPSEFNEEQLSSIKKSGTLSHLLCAVADNKEEMSLQRNIFQLKRRGNMPVPCSRMSFIDLRPWAKID